MKSKCPDATAHVQDDVNPHNLYMFEGTFSLDQFIAFISSLVVCSIVRTILQSTHFLKTTWSVSHIILVVD